MRALLVLAIIAALLVALSFLRLGGGAGYDETGAWLYLRVGPGRIPLYPSKTTPEKEAQKAKKKAARAEKKARKKAAKAAKKAKKKPGAQPPKKPALGGLLSLGLELLPVVQEAAGRLRRRIRIDCLSLDLTWGEEDPADAAIHYGYAWAAAEAILAFVEANFALKQRQVTINLDYQIDQPRVKLEAALSLTLGQLLAVVLPAGLGAVKALLALRRDKKQDEPTPKNTKEDRGAAPAAKGEPSHGKESSCE
jgi:hypothetical protein